MILRRILIYIIVYFLILLFENNFVYLIEIQNITPDLILIFVLIVAFREDRNVATTTGFLSGLFQDLFLTNFLGLSALTKSVIAFCGRFFHQPEKKYNLPHYMVTFLLFIFIHEFIYQSIYSLGNDVNFFNVLIFVTIPRSIYTWIMTMIVYFTFGNKLWNV